jgi:hypothetical protein
MTLRPDLCLVKLAPQTVATESGIILAPVIAGPICYGKVVQTGEDVYDVAIGDVVAFNAAHGDPVHDPFFVLPHLLIAEEFIDAVIPKRDAQESPTV